MTRGQIWQKLPKLLRLMALFPSPLKLIRKEKQPKDKVFGPDMPETSGTQTLEYPGKRLYARRLFCCFKEGVAGMYRDSGRDVPGSDKLYSGEKKNHYSPRQNDVISTKIISELFRKNMSSQLQQINSPRINFISTFLSQQFWAGFGSGRALILNNYFFWN